MTVRSRIQLSANMRVNATLYGQCSLAKQWTSIRPHIRNGARNHNHNHCPRRWNSTTTTNPPTNDPVIFSGIQPTGVPHLGNYLGALREWVRLQNDATEGTRLFFSIADLHSLTVPQDSSQLREWRKQTLATLLAVGLDPARCTLFYQSSVRVSSGRESSSWY